jgi:hypothetical protein
MAVELRMPPLLEDIAGVSFVSCSGRNEQFPAPVADTAAPFGLGLSPYALLSVQDCQGGSSLQKSSADFRQTGRNPVVLHRFSPAAGSGRTGAEDAPTGPAERRARMRGNAKEDIQTGVNTSEAWPHRPSWDRRQTKALAPPASAPGPSPWADYEPAIARIGPANRVLPRPAALQSGEPVGIGGWLRGYSADGSRNVATVARSILRLVLIGAVLTAVLLEANLGWHWAQEGHAVAAEPTAQVAPETVAPSPLRMGPVSTGIAVVDDAVRPFLEGDVDRAFSQLVVQQVRCGTIPLGGTPALSCPAAEAPGTVHELILATCEPKWVTAEAAKAELGALLAEVPGLYAVTRGNAGYTAVLSWPDAPDRSLVLTISSAGVTSYGAGCGLPVVPKPGRELEFLVAPGR